MNPSNPAKFGMAFALGLVVALAGATFYVKSSGLRANQGPTQAPAVSLSRQPETLTAPKGEEPAAAPVPKTLELPQVAPVVAVNPRPPAAITKQTKPAVQHTAHVAHRHYPRQTFPESQSAIRVEVSQIRTASGSQAITPVPAPQTIRTVDEYAAEQPAQPQPVQLEPVSVTAPPEPQPHVVTLQSGTTIAIRMGETLSSERNFSGDTFRATLDRPIIMDGFVIAEKGSKVLGKIAGLDKGGKFKGGSALQLSLTELNTTDGQHIHIQTAFVSQKGPASNGSEIAKVGGGAVLGALIGGLAGGGKGAAIGAGAGGAAGAGAVMLGKGRPAVIHNETPLTFQLAAPTTITEHLN